MQKQQINTTPIFLRNHLKRSQVSRRALEDVRWHSSSDFSLWSRKQRHHHSFRKPYTVITFVGENRLN